MNGTILRSELRVLVRDHTNLKRWETRYRNALKLKANGEEQKRPTPYMLSESYERQVTLWMNECKEQLKEVEAAIRKIVHQLLIWTEWAAGVGGIGELTIGYLEAHVDLDQATANGLVVISKVNRFCGYGDPNDRHGEHDKKRCFCASLKTQLYTTGMSLEKSRNNLGHKFGKIYDDTKHRLESNEHLVEEMQKGGARKEVAWKDAKPGHRRNAAIRRMIKEVLKEYTLARAALEGREVRPPYAEQYLGHKHSE